MKKLMMRNFLLLLLSFCLVSCLDDDDDEPTTISPDDAVTNGITFQGGQVKSGTPPAATNNPGDPFLTEPSLGSSAIEGGDSGSLSIQLNNMPTGQTFNVNVRFGQSAKYINVPITNSSLINNIANEGGTGTLNLPFTMPSNICDNVDDIQHQIDCYESVDVGDGTMVSKETARSMILACGNASDGNDDGGGTGGSGNDFATGANDYCADNYPFESCEQLNNTANINTSYKRNSSCGASFPNSTILADYGCSANSSVFSSCGACAVEVGSASVPESLTPEEALYQQFEQYVNNPELQSKITFTPSR